MRKPALTILTACLLLMASCFIYPMTEAYRYNHWQCVGYSDSKLSFFDEGSDTDDNPYSDWIRKPENILAVHETFKKMGYKRLLEAFGSSGQSYFSWDNGYFTVHGNISITELIDSLCLTYPLDTIPSTYFREFWQRRKAEANDQVVYQVLKEVQAILAGGEPAPVNPALVNDTLRRIIEIETAEDHLNDSVALQNFYAMRDFGLNKSAMNTLYGRSNYRKIHWNQKRLSKTLKRDTADHYTRAWFRASSELYFD